MPSVVGPSWDFHVCGLLLRSLRLCGRTASYSSRHRVYGECHHLDIHLHIPNYQRVPWQNGRAAAKVASIIENGQFPSQKLNCPPAER